MQRHTSFISLVAPVYNSEGFISNFVEEAITLLQTSFEDFELILIDDCSTDATATIIRELLSKYPNLRSIRLARKHGRDIALLAGMESAIGDYIAFCMPETDPLNQIVPMLELAQKGAGVVTGIAPIRIGEGWLKRHLRKLFSMICEKIFHLSYPRHATRFQIISRQAAASLIRAHTKHPQFPILASQVGFGSAEWYYQPRLRAGVTHLERSSSIDRAISILVLNSISPLRIMSSLGVIGSCFNLLYALYVVIINFVKDRVAEGWTTLSLQISLMFFLLFLILIVLSEYIGKILEEARDRPLYDVLEERNGSIVLEFKDRRNVTTEPQDAQGK